MPCSFTVEPRVSGLSIRASRLIVMVIATFAVAFVLSTSTLAQETAVDPVVDQPAEQTPPAPIAGQPPVVEDVLTGPPANPDDGLAAKRITGMARMRIYGKAGIRLYGFVFLFCS